MSMTITAPDLSTIEDLDFPIPCEHSEHPTRHVVDQPAAYIIAFQCPACGRTGRYPMCESGWTEMHRASDTVWDKPGCGARVPLGETMWIAEVLS